MPITDLTGYTWVAKEGALDNILPASYSINFISNNQNFTSLVLTKLSMIKRYISYGNLQVYDSGTWDNEAYKIIQITGGTDATNSTLIAWLEANGTLTAPATPSGKTKLGTLNIAKKMFGTLPIVKEVLVIQLGYYEG